MSEGTTIKKTANTINQARIYARLMKGLGLEVEVAAYGWWIDDEACRDIDPRGRAVEILKTSPYQWAEMKMDDGTVLSVQPKTGAEPGHMTVFGTQY